MRRTAILLAALLTLSVTAGCGDKETADSYADKLASGEIKPGDVKVDVSEKSDEETEAPTEAAAGDVTPTAAEATAAPVTETESVGDNGTEVESDGVKLSLSEEDMGKLVDDTQDDYKSFEMQPIETGDFFTGKKLRVVATIQDHQLQNVYEADIEAEFTDGKMKMKYPTSDGTTEQEFNIYTIADKPLSSPQGRQYSYIAYGEQELTQGNMDGTISLISLVKMRDDVDMGEAKADTYIMLQETSNSGVLNILKIE